MNFHNETGQAPSISVLGQSITNTCKIFHMKGVNQVVENRQ